MQELKELINRFINIKSKSLLLQNELKDLNNRTHYQQILSMYFGTEAICESLLNEINQLLINLDIDEVIETLKKEKIIIEAKDFKYEDYRFDNYKYYNKDAYEFIINYLSQCKLSLK